MSFHFSYSYLTVVVHCRKIDKLQGQSTRSTKNTHLSTNSNITHPLFLPFPFLLPAYNSSILPSPTLFSSLLSVLDWNRGTELELCTSVSFYSIPS
jgi:hypothetical protein